MPVLLYYTGFQKRVLFLLTEIRDNIQQLGKKYECDDSDYHIQQIGEPEELQSLDKELSDSTASKNQMVMCILNMIKWQQIIYFMISCSCSQISELRLTNRSSLGVGKNVKFETQKCAWIFWKRMKLNVIHRKTFRPSIQLNKQRF